MAQRRSAHAALQAKAYAEASRLRFGVGDRVWTVNPRWEQRIGTGAVVPCPLCIRRGVIDEPPIGRWSRVGPVAGCLICNGRRRFSFRVRWAEPWTVVDAQNIPRWSRAVWRFLPGPAYTLARTLPNGAEEHVHGVAERDVYPDEASAQAVAEAANARDRVRVLAFIERECAEWGVPFDPTPWRA